MSVNRDFIIQPVKTSFNKKINNQEQITRNNILKFYFQIMFKWLNNLTTELLLHSKITKEKLISPAPALTEE